MFTNPPNPSNPLDGYAQFEMPSGLELFALRCGTLGHWRATRVRWEARLQQLAHEDGELRRLRMEALQAAYPALARIRSDIEAREAFGRAEDGAVSVREVARLRFLRWLREGGHIGWQREASERETSENDGRRDASSD